MRYHLSHLPEVQAAIDATAACATLDQLTAAIHAFDAHEICRTPAMPGHGGSRYPGTNAVMILGKSPAATESGTGVPFSGPAGQVLREEMAIAGYDLEACWITGATPWRARKDNTPNATQLAISRPFLMREIQLVRPAVIIALGQKAHEALFQVAENLGDKPGTFMTLDIGGEEFTVLQTICHAYCMYGRAERAPGFRQHFHDAAAAHPEAFAAIAALPLAA